MNDAPLKVLVLADSRSFHTERYVEELDRQGADVFLASLEHGDMHHIHLSERGPFKSLHYVLVSTQISHLVHRIRPDVVNPHFVSGYGFAVALAGKLLGTPVLGHAWGSDLLVVPNKSWLHRRKTVLGLNAASHLLADSQYLGDKATELAPSAKVTVIPWGVERKYVVDDPTPIPLSPPLRVIVPRAHSPVYNNEFVLDSLRSLIEQGSVQLTFPSFGISAEEFKVRVGDLLDNGVTLYDKCDRDTFMQVLSEHDVYLSAAKSDSSPVSMIEAMARGLVTVAADIPGVREWLPPESGLLFAQDDASSLQGTITDLALGQRDIVELQQRNLARVREQAIFEDNIATTLDIMRSLVETRQNGA